GADTDERLGPRRVTQSGDFSYATVMKAAAMMFLGSFVFGAPLVIYGGLPILVIGILSVLCGYAYTSGPFPLAYRGLGDLFVIVFFGIVPVMGTFYLHTFIWDLETVLVGLQVGFLSAVLIAINNLRDIHTDSKVGKKTLAVRLGVEGAKIEIQLLILIPFLLNFYWLYRNQEWLFLSLIPFLSLPIAVILSQKIKRTEPSREYNSFLGKAAALHLIFGMLLTMTFLVIN
ncbi:MAG: 1,4-dihydroxy-2-naphthoate octaprenyltransferase, partial [Pseudobdellovibrionaceae bacterium]